MPSIEYSHTFHYRLLPGPATRYVPALELILRRDEIECPVFALVDTGAEHSLFSGELAETLGLSLQSGPRKDLMSLGGPLAAYAHRIEIDIAYGWSLGATEVLFSDRNIPHNLIGRFDILFQLVLGLSERTGLIYLSNASF